MSLPERYRQLCVAASPGHSGQLPEIHSASADIQDKASIQSLLLILHWVLNLPACLQRNIDLTPGPTPWCLTF